eukprot:CAMPEP_0172322318 /NCGR_PEP_ID=MMETSP1058-20130122/45581_1 /TAXON_ID=83371 /ORGANISM="Detonula confervacea, Strain CCMP 353" /LENGTH=59 /DNA_ID=CAMNT_0013038039 /DNA_START=305 /DNA_END=481 /DNA_ORIENTATION=+
MKHPLLIEDPMQFSGEPLHEPAGMMINHFLDNTWDAIRGRESDGSFMVGMREAENEGKK